MFRHDELAFESFLTCLFLLRWFEHHTQVESESVSMAKKEHCVPV